MGIKKIWSATLAFRKFREKTHELSKIYWVQQLGVDCLKEMLNNKNPKSHTAKVLPSSFEFRMYPAEVGDTLASLPGYMDRSRLYLLVVYTAFLESYLKEITFFHIATQGYVANFNAANELLKLNPVGKALGAPVLEKSSVPALIKYAGNLFDIDFGKNAEDWVKFYQVRCEVAHNGGIATPEFFKRISGMNLKTNPKEYEMLGLTWDELRTSMRTADEIAATIDSKMACYPIQLFETEQVLRELNIVKQLPKRNRLWEFIHTEYGLKVKRKDKLALENKFY
jgi:hypothetical protein